MGLLSDTYGVTMGMGVLLLCAAYLLVVSWINIRKKIITV
jgi:hypothetical protein